MSGLVRRGAGVVGAGLLATGCIGAGGSGGEGVGADSTFEVSIEGSQFHPNHIMLQPGQDEIVVTNNDPYTHKISESPVPAVGAHEGHGGHEAPAQAAEMTEAEPGNELLTGEALTIVVEAGKDGFIVCHTPGADHEKMQAMYMPAANHQG
jgi:hypothetical protein